MPPDNISELESGSGSYNSSNDPSLPNKVNNKGVFQCVHSCFNNIQIEPAWLLFAMGDSVVAMVVQTYCIERICSISKGYDVTVCHNLTQFQVQEEDVEQDASEFTMYQSLIQSGFPLIMSLFLGPLTDKYGYKPLMLYSLSGYMLYIVIMVCTFFVPMLPTKYLLIASLPLGFTGGAITLMISVYGYLASQTNSINRSYRLAAMSATYDIGTVLGFICGSTVFQRGSYLPTFLYCLMCYTLSFLYTLTCISERKPEETELGGSQTSSWISNTCSLEPIKEILHTTFKSRPGHRRMSILIISMATCLTFLAYSSKINQYLFARNKFGWDAVQFSKFSEVNTLLSGLGGAVLTLFFMKLLKFRDVNILLFTGISNLAAYSVFATANAEWHMYLGSGLQMFGGIAAAVFKSILSKCAHKDEYGKLLSFVICAELSMNFLSGPMYNSVYVQTVTILPGAIFWVAAGFTAVVLGLCGILHILTNNIVEYSFIVVDDE